MRGTALCGAAVVTFAGACGGTTMLTADNFGTELASAFCSAADRCCRAQGAPLSADDLKLCTLDEEVVYGVMVNANHEFNADVAAACLKAAAAYDCQSGRNVTGLCGL